MSTLSPKPLQGMDDLAAPDIYQWLEIESQAREVFRRYNCQEVRTPVLERIELFKRAVGEASDIVQKEMYNFTDRGGREVVMRPEGTASVMRYLSGLGPEAEAARLYYIASMFRSEKPQADRKRQFHQVGAEVMGAPNSLADVECICLQLALLDAWGVKNFKLKINTLGEVEEAPGVAEELRNLLRPHLDQLPEKDQERFKLNVLRVLDSKYPETQAILDSLPPVSSFLSDESTFYFEEVKRYLDLAEVSYEVNPRLVRGLDYYQHTVWEISHPGLGAQDALSGGGRYVLPFGKKGLNGVGFAMGVERLITAIRSEGIEVDSEPYQPQIWFVSLGEKALEANLLLALKLRSAGYRCGFVPEARSMKAQMRAANNSKAKWALIRGDAELEQQQVVLKNMETGDQESLAEVDVTTQLQSYLVNS